MSVVNHAALLLLQVIVIALLILVHRSLPALKHWLNSHTTLQQRQVLGELGREAFRYAEAVFASSSGQEKLTQALRYASSVAKRQGLSLSAEELRTAIEQAVHDANRFEQKNPTSNTGPV